MKAIGSLLFIIGVIATILSFTDYRLRVLQWMDELPEMQQWLIRGGLIVLGAVLWIAGNKKQKPAQ